MLRGWCAVFFLLLSSQAMAFGKTGHQMICAMAYQLIEASSKARLDALIKASPYQRFDVACNWPDTVRDEPEHQWSTPLHYINFPRSAAAPSVDDCPEYGCILTGISMMQARLEQDNSDWQALLFLAHLVSDIHQPLHVSFADDLGGNRTAVYFLGLPTNLHSVWDFALLKQAGYEQDALQWLPLLAAIEPAQQQLWQQSSALDWANESAAITQQLYQHYKPGMLLDDNYVTQNIPVVEQRIQQAAVRLALLLDQVFRTE
jgi:hypothetical protein